MKHLLFPIGDYQYGRDVDMIGTGSFGVIHRAFWVPRHIYVALKFVSGRGEAGRAQVQAEERGAALQQLFAERHPGIVPAIYEHGRSINGDYYIAMELLEGRPLAEHLKTNRVSPERAAGIARWIAGELLENLHTFHRETGELPDQIVYSDLKPEHIFMMRDGSLRALDFGITKAVQDARTSTLNPWASIPYASPRRLREGVVDADSDFWALGVMLYEMIAGHHPYPALRHGSPETLARAIQRQDAIAPLTSCPPSLAAIVRKLLAPDRDESYQRASDIAADLDAFLEGREPVAASQQIRQSVPTAVVPPSRGATEPVLPYSAPTDPVPMSTPLPPPALPPLPGAAARPKRRPRRAGRFFVRAFAIVALVSFFSEVADWMRAEALTERIATLEASDVPELRAEYRDKSKRTVFGRSLPRRLRATLKERLVTLGERPMHDFRTELPVVAKPHWEQAREAFAFAAELDPSDTQVAARLKYVDAHLLRIAAGTNRKRLEDAVLAFRQAARLDRSLPDPYLGLARIHAYDLRDFDALQDDLREAEERGHEPGRRERAQLGDGYRVRADRLRQRAGQASGDERLDLMRQALGDYASCVENFSGLGTFLDSDRNLAYCQTRHDRLKAIIDGIERGIQAPGWWGR